MHQVEVDARDEHVTAFPAAQHPDSRVEGDEARRAVLAAASTGPGDNDGSGPEDVVAAAAAAAQQRLEDMGFSALAASRALATANGDDNAALELLLTS